jgi:hypothetical protein
VRWGGAALAVATLMLIAGCTSSGQPVGGSRTPTPVTTTSSSAASPTPIPTLTITDSSTAPQTSTTATATATVTSTPASASTSTSTPPPPVRTTCKKVTVRVIPGGASPGEEIAAVQFVNSGVRTCTMAGYPTVTLLRKGSQIGQPSQPSTTKPSVRKLQPGDVAESLLHDYTQTCQAPLSDSVKVRVPGTSITYVRPGMQLRACVLRVDRLGAPD